MATTTDQLYCNAGLQYFTTQAGINAITGDTVWLEFNHNEIKMQGYLDSYNVSTGEASVVIERYNGIGGKPYTGWQVTKINKPEDDIQINVNLLKQYAQLTGTTYVTYEEFGNLATMLGRIYKGVYSMYDGLPTE